MDTLKFYQSFPARLVGKTAPTATLLAMSPAVPVEFVSGQTHHNFDLQLKGCLKTDWLRGRRISRQLLIPGHTSLNVASEQFRCIVHPTEFTSNLHVTFSAEWMNAVRESNWELCGRKVSAELLPTMGDWAPRVRRVGLRITEALRQFGGPLHLQMGEYLQQLGVELWRANARLQGVTTRLRTEKRERLSRDVLTKVFDYLQASLADDISLESVAGIAGVSTWHFARAFRTSVGVPLWQYFKELRITEARRRLLENELSITEIALGLGFNSPSHFGSAFRVSTGVTPSRFRRELL